MRDHYLVRGHLVFLLLALEIPHVSHFIILARIGEHSFLFIQIVVLQRLLVDKYCFLNGARVHLVIHAMLKLYYFYFYY